MLTHNHHGFTLIELLMGAVIFAMIGTLTYGALFGTLKTQQTVDEKTTLQETGTSIITKIRDDFLQTFHVDSTRPMTRFMAADNQDLDRVEFTSLSHYPVQSDLKESDQTIITYYIEPNPADNSVHLLMRKETPFIAAVDAPSQPEAEAIAINDQVIKFNLEYFDGESFKREWNIQAPETLNKLPRLVRITLTIRDYVGREKTFQTVADVSMSDNLGETQQAAGPSNNPGAPGTPTATPAPPMGGGAFGDRGRMFPGR